MNVETNVSLNQILHFVGGLCGIISLFHDRLSSNDFNSAEALYHTFQAFVCFAIIPIFSVSFFLRYRIPREKHLNLHLGCILHCGNNTRMVWKMHLLLL